jgi:flagellin-like hook-associated protein FlgL
VVNLSLDGIDLELTLPAVPAAESDSTTLRFEQQSDNILNTMLDTVEILRQPTDGIPAQQTALEARLALTLDQVTMAQDRLSLGSASLGSRLNTLDSAELTNSDFQLMTEGTRSAVQDLDYAAAATELSKRQLALEAAYSSFAKIQGLSLFNYIR